MTRLFYKYSVLILLLFLATVSNSENKTEVVNVDDVFKPVQDQLVSEGFDKNYIQSLYKKKDVNVELKIVSLFFNRAESKIDYGQFVTDNSIKKAKKYIDNQKIYLESAEKNYGVSKEVITAIILVESRLGNLFGKTYVFNTLSTLASLSDASSRNIILENLSLSQQEDITAFNLWADKKSKWAFNELVSFLKYTDKEKIDPFSIKGSYAGAIGVCQFIPSSVLSFAKDGDKNNHIDLFNHADAIESVANFLKSFGWRPEINKTEVAEVLRHYNNNTIYIETILKITEKLKSQH